LSLWSKFKNSVGFRDSVDKAHPRDPVLAEWFSGGQPGRPVTAETAMSVTAVYACVSLLQETLAAFPLHVLREREGENAKAYDHPLYRVLHDRPNQNMTSFEWREMMVGHTALRGDSYSQIIQDNAGRIVALRPIRPDVVYPEQRADGRIQYRVYEGNTVRVYFDDEILRFPYKMMDGVRSLSPIGVHRETIGLAGASKRFLEAIYRNNAAPKGALVASAELSPEAVAALRKSWEERHMGPENAGRIAILDGGLDWKSMGMSMNDAQYVELQNFSVADIARIFGVPPHKIGDLSKATFSNIEHQSIEFVQSCILPWVRRLESRMNEYLLSDADRQAGYYIAFDLKGLLRGDAAARASFYRQMFYIGAMNPNEIRAGEDMNPYEGGGEFYVQGATVPVDMLGGAPPAPPANPNNGGQ
jgi:HK97 family phage portal protein